MNKYDVYLHAGYGRVTITADRVETAGGRLVFFLDTSVDAKVVVVATFNEGAWLGWELMRSPPVMVP